MMIDDLKYNRINQLSLFFGAFFWMHSLSSPCSRSLLRKVRT
jgi:hypothetical protein